MQGIDQLGSDPSTWTDRSSSPYPSIGKIPRLDLGLHVTDLHRLLPYRLTYSYSSLHGGTYPHVGSIDFSTAFRRLYISRPCAPRAAISKWLVSPTKALFHHLMHKSKWVSTLDTGCTVRVFICFSLRMGSRFLHLHTVCFLFLYHYSPAPPCARHGLVALPPNVFFFHVSSRLLYLIW